MRSCGDGNKNSQAKSVGLISKKQLCTCSTLLIFFLHFFAVVRTDAIVFSKWNNPTISIKPSTPPPPASNGLEINKPPWVLNGRFTVIYVFYSKAAFRSHESKTTDSTHRNRLQWRIQGGHPDPEISGGWGGRGGAVAKKKISVWSKIKGRAGPPGLSPGVATGIVLKLLFRMV